MELTVEDSYLLDGHLGKNRLQFRLAGLAVKSARSVYPRKRECSAADMEKLVSLNRLIELHYKSDRPVKFYSSELAISIKTLNRLCSFVMGQTVYQLVMDKRLREARKLLAGRDITLREIGAEVGFDKPSCFSRFFKDMTGMSPRDYRYKARRNGSLSNPRKALF